MTISSNLPLIRKKVFSNEQISPTSAILKLVRWFDFLPGQVVNLTTSEEIPPRMYSIASGNTTSTIDLLYKIVPEGELTPKLFELRSGDTVLCSEAFGKFTCRNEESWFIATGTGIAPFLSMIRSGYKTQKTLIHGVRNPEDFYFARELFNDLGPNYIRCCTGSEEDNYFRGRVTDYLENQDQLPVNIKYYLCGSAEMVVDTRQLLISMGIPFQNILSEIYF